MRRWGLFFCLYLGYAAPLCTYGVDSLAVRELSALDHERACGKKGFRTLWVHRSENRNVKRGDSKRRHVVKWWRHSRQQDHGLECHDVGKLCTAGRPECFNTHQTQHVFRVENNTLYVFRFDFDYIVIHRKNTQRNGCIQALTFDGLKKRFYSMLVSQTILCEIVPETNSYATILFMIEN